MSSTQEFFLRVFWNGGSTFDAWLNISAAKMASRILTLPQSVAQMGLPFAIVLALAQVVMGIWTQRIINALYLKHMAQKTRSKHVTQLHEVVAGLLNSYWRVPSLIFNVLTIFTRTFNQLIASADLVYLLNKRLDKRTLISILSPIFSLSIFIPSAQNYRVWSFIGVLTTTFASVYLTASSVIYSTDSGVKHSTPHSHVEFYDGVSGSTTLGHVVIPVEIMDAMWKPQEYNVAYLYGAIYIFVVAMAPAISLNINFGDKLLTTTNALRLFPASRTRDTTIILLLVHVVINAGMFSLALYAMWEKMLGVHESPSYMKRTLCRVPVFFAIWLTALAFPFFGVVNRLGDSALATWNLYIIPCVVYILVFRSEGERKQSKSLTRLGWAADFSISLGIILWVAVVESGLASWADTHVLLKSKGVRPFAKCFGC